MNNEGELQERCNQKQLGKTGTGEMGRRSNGGRPHKVDAGEGTEGGEGKLYSLLIREHRLFPAPVYLSEVVANISACGPCAELMKYTKWTVETKLR